MYLHSCHTATALCQVGPNLMQMIAYPRSWEHPQNLQSHFVSFQTPHETLPYRRSEGQRRHDTKRRRISSDNVVNNLTRAANESLLFSGCSWVSNKINQTPKRTPNKKGLFCTEFQKPASSQRRNGCLS